MTMFIEEKVMSTVSISDEETKAYFDTNPDEFKMPERIRASHILLKMDPKATDASKAETLKKIEEIRSKLDNGEDFAKLAKLYSEDPASAKRGGDLGFTQRGDLVPEYEAIAFNLKDGEISDIVQTQFGFHIIQLIERRGERIHTRHILIQVKPTEEDEKRIVEQCYQDPHKNVCLE